jgi:hypothetical protein
MRLELPHPMVGRERGPVVSVVRLLPNVRDSVLLQLRADLISKEGKTSYPYIAQGGTGPRQFAHHISQKFVSCIVEYEQV